MKWILIAALLMNLLPGFPAETRAAGSCEGRDSVHELTLYVMQPVVPLNWDSPSSLYKSVRKGSVAKILRHRQYLIGHMAVKLKTPLLDTLHFSAMASASAKEKKRLLVKDKIGMGIIGIPLKGKIETADEIRQTLRHYARLGKIGYIRYLISEEAALRSLAFIRAFRESREGYPPPACFYGGAFWPGYEHEGAGCSAYGMMMLDLSGISGPEQENWMVKVGIPKKLIGGGLNNQRQITRRDLAKAEAWCPAVAGSADECVPFGIVDPCRVYQWILHCRKAGNQVDFSVYKPEMTEGIPGLVRDCRHIVPSVSEPIFKTRETPSLFIDYFRKTQSGKVPAAQ